MAFTITTATCKTCGGINLVPGGKLKGMGFDDCLKCREARTKKDQPRVAPEIAED